MGSKPHQKLQQAGFISHSRLDLGNRSIDVAAKGGRMCASAHPLMMHRFPMYQPARFLNLHNYTQAFGLFNPSAAASAQVLAEPHPIA